MEFGRSQTVKGLEIQVSDAIMRGLKRGWRPFWKILAATSCLIRPLSNQLSMVYYRAHLRHLKQVMSMLESNREVIASLVDLYLANNRPETQPNNEPIDHRSHHLYSPDFLVGVWGMNFKGMRSSNGPTVPGRLDTDDCGGGIAVSLVSTEKDVLRSVSLIIVL
jgi:hypothetical protein